MNHEYSGIIVASSSRQTLGIHVVISYKDGNLIERKRVEINPFSMAGGPALTILNYLLENLQPAFMQNCENSHTSLNERKSYDIGRIIQG